MVWRKTNWLCTCKYGRGVEFRSTEIKLQFVRGTWTSDLGFTNTLRALTVLATQSSAGYTPCCVGRPQSGAELQWETLLSRAASLLALDSIVTLQSSSPHSMMENRHFLVTGIRSKVLSLCWRSPFASVSSRSLRRVNNALNNGLDRTARDYLF